MCVVCILHEKGKLTSKEALGAFWEMVLEDVTESELRHIRKKYAELEEKALGE